MMPAKAAIAESEFVSWSAPGLACTVEYPPEVMEEMRAYACDSLLQLSHGGREVGGVMYGSQRPGVVRILTWRPIASEYAEGDALRLSHTDRMTLAVQFEAARGNPELKDLRPVGWFVSHHQPGVGMTPSDFEVYSGFFPESSQVTLVIHPIGAGRAEAGFFVREAHGGVRLESSYKSFVLEPAIAPPIAPSEARSRPSLPAATVNALSITAPAPAFKTVEPLANRERWLWAIPIALALGFAAWMLYQRQKPAEGSPIAFRISAFEAPSSGTGRAAQLEWDSNSRAVLGSERGEIDITDGGKSSRVTLSSDQVRFGKMTYLAQSGDVEFELILYAANGAPVHETARLFAPAFSAPTEPDPPIAQDGALQKRIDQLTVALGKERARADGLQNLVRILEDRLGIQPEEPKAEPQP
jgi:hypothetical protein